MMRFTATTYVFRTDMKKMILLWHKKMKSWLPPGGHVEEDETPSEAALREILEETGIAAELLEKNENEFEYEDREAATLAKPEILLLEKKTCGKCGEHVDFIYVAREKTRTGKTEGHDRTWVDAKEFEALEPMLENARQIGRHVFKKYGYSEKK